MKNHILESFIRSSKQGFAICEFSGIENDYGFAIKDCNEAFKHICGLNLSDGCNFDNKSIDSIAQLDFQSWNNAISNLSSTNILSEIELFIDTLNTYLNFSFYYIDNQYFTITVDDISERKLVQLRYAKKQHLLAKLLEISQNVHNLSLDELIQSTLDFAEKQTNSSIAFYHFIEEDQNTILLQTWSTNTLMNMCKAVGKGTHYPIDEAGVWAEGLRSKETVVINDYKNARNKKGMPDGHAEVTRLISLPVVRNGVVKSVIGVGNKTTVYNDEDVETLNEIAQVLWNYVENKKQNEVLQIERDKATAYLDIAGVMILALDSQENVRLINRKGAEILGLESEDIVGKNWFDSFIPIENREALRQTFKHVTNGSKSLLKSSINSVFNSFGEERMISWHNRVIYDANANISMILSAGEDITERIKIEEALRISEKRLNTLMNNLPGMAYRCKNTSDWLMVFVNDAVLSLTGYSAEEITSGNPNFGDLILPEYQDYVFNIVQNANREDKNFELEYKISTKDGLIKDVWEKGRLVDVSDDGIYSLEGFIIDITDRKNAQERYKTIIETSMTGFVIVDNATGKFLDVNDSYCKIIGYSKEELLSMHIFEIDAKESQQDTLEHMEYLIQNGSDRFLSKQRTKDGCVIDVEISATYINTGRGVFYSFIEDVTEKLNYQKQLDSNYTLLKLAGETAQFGGWYVEMPEGKVFWSDVVAILHEMPLGYSPILEEAINFYTPESQQIIRKVFSDCAEFGLSFDNELEIITSLGNKLWARVTGVALKDDYGNIYRLQGSFQDISERKKFEHQLMQEKILYQTLSDTAPALIYYKDKNSVYQSANKTFCDFVGVLPSKIKGKTDFDLFPEVSALAFIEDDKSVINKLVAIRNRIEENIRNDGSRMWFQISKTPLVNKNGEVYGLVGMSLDVTENILAQEQVKESEVRFKKMFENHNAIMLLIEPESGKIINANQAAAKFYGYTITKMKELMIGDINDLSEKQISEERRNAKLQNRNYFVFPHKLANGDIRMVEAHSTPIKYQNNKVLFSIIHDITERLQAQEALKFSQERLDSIFRVIPTGVGVVINRTIVEVNPKLIEITGYSREELIGCDAMVLYPDKESYEYVGKEKYKQIEEFGTGTVETKWKRKDNKIIDVLLSSTPIDFNDYNQGVTFTAMDISDRKEMEVTLINNEHKLKDMNIQKDKFFSIISHDLRNPLGTFKGYTKLLYDSYFDFTDDEKYGIIRDLKNSSENIYSLLENLLDWSRSQRGVITFKPELINLKMLVSFSYDLLLHTANKKNIKINNLIDDQVELLIDQTMINTVIRNLISNAIKFTPENGQIDIGTFEINEIANFTVVFVKDSGVGIKQESQENLFRIDQNTTSIGTSGEKGTGLGLILCKEFIEKHGGSIWVESEYGKGSIFYFTIPKSN